MQKNRFAYQFYKMVALRRAYGYPGKMQKTAYQFYKMAALRRATLPVHRQDIFRHFRNPLNQGCDGPG